MAPVNLVSVILPTYNRAKYIVDAIESVLNQTYPDIELIIVDDGSTDDTRQVVAPFLADRRVRYVEQKNAGAASARNRGIRMSAGRFVAFIDSDDIWEKNKLEIQLSVLKQQPEVALVCSDFSAKDDEGRVERSHIKTYFSVFDDYNLSYQAVFGHELTEGLQGLPEGGVVYWGKIYETMLFGNLILTSTCLCCRDVFSQIGVFNTQYETLEDYDLFLRITDRFDAAFVDQPLVCYRYSKNQLSGEVFFGKLCKNLIEIFEKNVASIHDPTFLKRNKKRIKRHRGMIHAQLAYFYFSHDKMALAANFYWKSIRYHPGRCKPYLYLVFSLLPVGITRLIRKSKAKIAS